MADETWSPKTKEEFQELMGGAVAAGLAKFRSDVEEAEAKGGTGENKDGDKTGKEKGGEGGSGGAGKGFVDRLLGL